ncbi:uncharacterized protein EV422DRAFT_536249 [Fimicolochytrium jonesii]|uniref:uncharacterized protein n=1 Tax=Fimicolochytrium jonesii TaxID=1396493 RepID=UPI0022FF3ABD|nr:uncharacterized protein EV422DRAFT_536249 [Fimicolochytrium jonesii]KAI8818996.1 hypothetical protein EV422DRAFT_536249 [Fimicolochytrium jonesii]
MGRAGQPRRLRPPTTRLTSTKNTQPDNEKEQHKSKDGYTATGLIAETCEEGIYGVDGRGERRGRGFGRGVWESAQGSRRARSRGVRGEGVAAGICSDRLVTPPPPQQPQRRFTEISREPASILLPFRPPPALFLVSTCLQPSHNLAKTKNDRHTRTLLYTPPPHNIIPNGRDITLRQSRFYAQYNNLSFQRRAYVCMYGGRSGRGGSGE